MAAPRSTICLSMIVKNEAPVIRRCLDSLRRLIDHWVIVDTGSTDGTQQIIRDHLRDIPGELFERPWVDFAHNRTEALQLAKGRADYVLVIDADEVIDTDPGFTMPPLSADSYNLHVHYGGCVYLRRQLVRDALAWRYEGVLHEYLTCPEAQTEQFLPGIRTVPRHDGARARDPLTYRRDALVLERALLDDPDNRRYVFYLAQSYRDGGDADLAIKNYQRRAAMGGWPEEVWFSLYQIAQLREQQSADNPSLWPQAAEAYLTAFQHQPDRAGPLYRLAMHYQLRGEYAISHLFLKQAVRVPRPGGERLFVEQALYIYQIALEYGVACYYVGDHVAAIETNNELLRSGSLPAHAIDQVIRNRRFSLDAIHPKPAQPAGTRPRVRVLVSFRNPGAALDDSLESALRQEYENLDLVLIDDGSTEDGRARLPLDRSGVVFERNDTPIGFDACVEKYGAGAELVVALARDTAFADTSAVANLAAAFEDPQCSLAYGQYRTASGTLGSAEPAADVEQFLKDGSRLAGESAIALRPALLAESAGSAGRGVAGLFRTAGFSRTRFIDEVVSVKLPATQSRAVTSQARVVAPPVVAGLPLVSCVMVTRDRLSLARRAIRSWADQTYPNRELVIVTDGTPAFRGSLERFVQENGIASVRFIAPEGDDLTLGRLRNISIEAARGEIVCQWDDDDISHPTRLMIQAEHMFRHNARGCFLTDHLQLIEDKRLLCWIDWTLNNTAQGTARLAPGTGMIYRDTRFRYPEAGPMARRGEDSMLLEQLFATVPVTGLSHVGHLYLYRYHGRNTFSQEHHYRLSSCRTPNSWLLENEEKLRAAVAYYEIARPVFVAGQEGPAFAVN